MIISNHAKMQMKERNISDQVVRKAITSPDEIVNTDEGRTVYHLRIKEEGIDYLLRAVAEQTGGEWLIITVYKTSKIEKYWRGENNEG